LLLYTLNRLALAAAIVLFPLHRAWAARHPARNYPVVLGAVLVTTICFVLCTLAADLITAALDPRVREQL
jgi:uncharacterized membrane protein